jgi:hypothetical protein
MKQANALDEQAFGEDKVEMEDTDPEWEQKILPAAEEPHHHEEDLTHIATDATAGDDWHIPIGSDQPSAPVVLDRLVDIPAINPLTAIPETVEGQMDVSLESPSRLASPNADNAINTEE